MPLLSAPPGVLEDVMRFVICMCVPFHARLGILIPAQEGEMAIRYLTEKM